MENMFITTYTLTKLFQINYDFKFATVINKFLAAEITSKDEYVEWVYQWKAYEKEIVAAIKFFRKMRKENSGDLANYYQMQKMLLRPMATKFYAARVEKKEFFKNSEFFNSPSINKVITKEKELC